MRVCIVGAGPVGCRVAELLADSGHDVIVFEEDEEVGVPVHCAGIVSPRLLDLVDSDSVLHEVGYARVFGDDVSFRVKGEALVIDREGFDKEMFEAAEEAGADFFLGERVVFRDRHFFAGGGRLEADFFVAADGARSSVREYFHPGYVRRGVLPAVQYLVEDDFDPEGVSIHLGPHYEGGGLFTWVVPVSDTLARVGTACSRPKRVLDGFLEDNLPDSRVRDVFAGSVVTGGIVRADYGRIKLVGDAAGQVKATTGGGLVPGLWCAEKLAESIDKGENYSRSCRLILNQLRLAYWTRFAWDRLSGSTKEAVLKSLKEDVGDLEEADVDWHSPKLVSLVVKELGLAPRILWDLMGLG